MAEELQVVFASFPNEQGAKQAFAQLAKAKERGMPGIRNATVLTKDSQQHLQMSEEDLDSEGLFNSFTRAVIEIFAPSGRSQTGGEGSIGARASDTQFLAGRLRKLGEELQPGSSALVAVIDSRSSEPVEGILEENGARLSMERIPAGTAEEFDE